MPTPHFAEVPVERLIRRDRILSPVYPGQVPARGDITCLAAERCSDRPLGGDSP